MLVGQQQKQPVRERHCAFALPSPLPSFCASSPSTLLESSGTTTSSGGCGLGAGRESSLLNPGVGSLNTLLHLWELVSSPE